MPLLKKIRVLAAKIETTPGAAIAISATDGAFNIFDLDISPDIPMTERMEQGGFGRLAPVAEGRAGEVSFKINPYGDGASGVPAWMATFFPACGMVDTTGTFSPVAAAPGTQTKTLTMGVYENGLLKKLRGAVGNCKLTFATSKLVEAEFTFRGVWDDPTDVAIVAPTYPSILPYRSTGTFTLGSWAPCFETFELDFGNVLHLRECQTDASGYLSGVITDRNPTISLNPESSLVATDDHFEDWVDSVNKAISYAITNGTEGLTFSAPAVGLTNIQPGDRSGVQIDTIEAVVLNDDFSIAIT